MKRIIALLSLIAASTVTYANYSCEGRVAYLGVDNGLHVSNGYGIHKICSLSEQPEKCNAWLSMAMSAQAQDRSVAIYYRDSTGKQSNSTTCSSVGNWVTPSDTVYFFRIK